MLNISNGIRLSNLPSIEKVSEFHRQCRFPYEELIVLDNYLRSLAGIVKKYDQKKRKNYEKNYKPKKAKEMHFF